MRRLRALDSVLLALLVPLWCLCLVLHVRVAASGRLAWLPVAVAGAEPGHSPRVEAFWPGSETSTAGLAVGDRVLRVGDRDLRGAGRLDFLVGVYAAADEALRVPLVIERDGRERAVEIELVPAAHPWRMLPLAVGLMVIGVVVILRRPRSVGARAAFHANAAYSLHWLFFPSPVEWQTTLWVAVFVATTFAIFPLILRLFQRLPDTQPPDRSRASRIGPWTFALLGVTSTSWILGTPFTPATGMRATFALNVAFIATALVVLARRFVRADPYGRRQIKWVLYGVYVGLVPVAASAAAAAVRPELLWLYEASLIALVAIPVCVLVALVRAHLFDIDRLISETATFTLLSIVIVAVVAFVVPRALALVGSGLEQSALARLVPSIAIALLIVPAQGLVRRQVERLFFAERHALEREMQGLLDALAACPDARTLFTLAGARLAELLKPESCVIYGASGHAHTPIFERGSGLPSAFRSEGPLVRALADRSGPLAVDRVAGRLSFPSADALDRAVLDGLAAAVLVPVRLRGALPAFVCLGEKRSGDVYTHSEIALLGALGDKLSSVLQQFDEAALYREAREMQEALRRYVPGAIAAGLESGLDLEPRETEISVLFVDIRGYTAFSRERRPEAIFSTINEYTEMVSRLVREQGGTVVEFNGDGMMSVFGAPAALPDKERAAVQAARAIVAEVPRLHVREGSATLSAGVGIATGPAFVGSIRAVDRLIWSAIGNTTNMAARFQSLTRSLDAAVVIDAATRGRAGASAADFAMRSGVTIRGYQEPLDVFVLGIEAEAIPSAA